MSFSASRLTVAVFVLLSTALPSRAQLVNIEKARMQSDTTGWMGNAGAAVSLIRNVTEVVTADVNAHLQYKSKRSLYLILGNYGFLKGAGNTLIDNSFLHLRYNYKINKTVRWEAFTQLQRNTITFISSRFLVGTGPRFKVVSNKIIRLYAASLMMYEYEKEIQQPRVTHHDIRNSSYVSFSITPNPYLELVSTTFFQPRIDNWNDYRILNQASLKVKAAKHFSVSVNWNYLNDNMPVAGIPSVNYTFSTGLDYEF